MFEPIPSDAKRRAASSAMSRSVLASTAIATEEVPFAAMSSVPAEAPVMPSMTSPSSHEPATERKSPRRVSGLKHRPG